MRSSLDASIINFQRNVLETLEGLVLVRAMLPDKGITITATNFVCTESTMYVLTPNGVSETTHGAYAMVLHSDVPFQSGPHTLAELIDFYDRGVIEITGARGRTIYLSKVLASYVTQI